MADAMSEDEGGGQEELMNSEDAKDINEADEEDTYLKEKEKKEEIKKRIRQLLHKNPNYKLQTVPKFAEQLADLSLAELIAAEENLILDIDQGAPWSDLERGTITLMSRLQSEALGVSVEEAVLADDAMRANFRESTHSLMLQVPPPIEFAARWVAKTLLAFFPEGVKVPGLGVIMKDVESRMTFYNQQTASVITEKEGEGSLSPATNGVRGGSLQQTSVRGPEVNEGQQEQAKTDA